MELYSWFDHKRSNNIVSTHKQLSYLAINNRTVTNIGYVWPAIKNGDGYK